MADDDDFSVSGVITSEVYAMNPLVIEEIVDTWSDEDRHAFWDVVAFKVADMRIDPDAAIVEAFENSMFAEMYL